MSNHMTLVLQFDGEPPRFTLSDEIKGAKVYVLAIGDYTDRVDKAIKQLEQIKEASVDDFTFNRVEQALEALQL